MLRSAALVAVLALLGTAAALPVSQKPTEILAEENIGIRPPSPVAEGGTTPVEPPGLALSMRVVRVTPAEMLHGVVGPGSGGKRDRAGGISYDGLSAGSLRSSVTITYSSVINN